MKQMENRDPVLLSFCETDQRIIDGYIAWLRGFVQNIEKDASEFKFDRDSTWQLMKCWSYHVNASQCHDFIFAGLSLLGEVAVHEYNCTWAVISTPDQRDYVLCHSAFPSPLVLKNIQEYAHSTELELTGSNENFASGWRAACSGEDEVAFKSIYFAWLVDEVRHHIQVRVDAFEKGDYYHRDLELWRIDRSFSFGIKGFPGRT